MAEPLGNGELTGLQAEEHRAHAAGGGVPEVPEGVQPRGDVAGVPE